MDENLARLHKQYPESRFVKLSKYVEGTTPSKATSTRWQTNSLDYDEAVRLVEDGYRIGWIAPNNVVVVDVDNNDDMRSQDYLLRLLEKFEVKYAYNYTQRGVHIVLRDPSGAIKTDSHRKCGLNIVIDTRANSTGYIVLPCNDPTRSWGNWPDFVEEIPYFLKPIIKDNTPSFIGMVEGDGRNDAMLKWRTRLEQSRNLTKEEIEKCIRIINENIFDTPMSNQELYKTVLRDKKESQNLNKVEKENVYNTIAEKIVAQYDIISNYGNFYQFNGVYYKLIQEVDIDRIIHFEISKNISKAGRVEIREFVRVKTEIDSSLLNKEWHKIACKNGIINLVTGELEEPNKMDYNTIYIPHEYKPDPVYSPKIDTFIKDVTGGDVRKIKFLYEIAGYCLLKDNIFRKFFLFKGEGGTGKSTYTNLLQMLVGNSMNCSYVALENMDKDYYLATMHNKLVNIDDDVADGKVLEATGRFKSIIAGERISARPIYREPIDFNPFCTCVFSCNRLPRIMDKTTGLYDRMVLIELNHKVEHPDPLFMAKITEQDMEYFLFKAVEGIKNAIEEGHFEIHQTSQQLLSVFKRRQSALSEWLYDNDIRLKDLHQAKCQVLFRQFSEWSDINGYTKRMTSFSFREDICALYNVEVRYAPALDGQIPMQIFYRHGEFDPDYSPFAEG